MTEWTLKTVSSMIHGAAEQYDLTERRLLMLLTAFGGLFIEGYSLIEQPYDNHFIFNQPAGNWLILIVLEQYQKQSWNCTTVEFIRDHYDSAKYEILFLGTETKASPSHLQIMTNKVKEQAFYQRDSFVPQFNGTYAIDSKKEGTLLHRAVELFLQGRGRICNYSLLAKCVIRNHRFNYLLQQVFNTIRVVVALHVLNGSHSVLHSQPWLRRETARRFYRPDLILVSSKSARIVDWKFSVRSASEILQNSFRRSRSKLYQQLVQKQHRCECQSWICSVSRVSNGPFHYKFTMAQFVQNRFDALLDLEAADERVASSDSQSERELEDEEKHTRVVMGHRARVTQSISSDNELSESAESARKPHEYDVLSISSDSHKGESETYPKANYHSTRQSESNSNTFGQFKTFKKIRKRIGSRWTRKQHQLTNQNNVQLGTALNTNKGNKHRYIPADQIGYSTYLWPSRKNQ